MLVPANIFLVPNILFQKSPDVKCYITMYSVHVIGWAVYKYSITLHYSTTCKVILCFSFVVLTRWIRRKHQVTAQSCFPQGRRRSKRNLLSLLPTFRRFTNPQKVLEFQMMQNSVIVISYHLHKDEDVYSCEGSIDCIVWSC